MSKPVFKIKCQLKLNATMSFTMDPSDDSQFINYDDVKPIALEFDDSSVFGEGNQIKKIPAHMIGELVLALCRDAKKDYFFKKEEEA